MACSGYNSDICTYF